MTYDIIIGVISVYMQYDCVYYCDTCYIRSTYLVELLEVYRRGVFKYIVERNLLCGGCGGG
jgi:hypothetical protein